MPTSNPQAHPLKIVLSYDGTEFHGWQVQPGLATVQGTLAKAIQWITGETVLPQGSGRTDAGVHAEGQVASFALTTPIPARNLLDALNRRLPPSIRALSLQEVEADFHARRSARGKTYEYRIHTAALCPPTLARYVHDCPWKLSMEDMQRAAEAVLGEHDFTSFAACDPDRQQRMLDAAETFAEDRIRGNVRSIGESRWERRGDLLVYTVRGNGFLHHMVRNLVGTFIDVGRGAIRAEAVESILAARDRSAAGPTAPAQGLFLTHVEY